MQLKISFKVCVVIIYTDHVPLTVFTPSVNVNRQKGLDECKTPYGVWRECSVGEAGAKTGVRARTRENEQEAGSGQGRGVRESAAKT